MGNLKRNDTNELIYGKKNRLTDSENILMVARGRMVGTDRELGIHMYTLLFLKQITNKNHCKKPGGQVNSVILIIQIFLQVRSYVEAQYEKGLRLAPHRRA